MTTTFEFKPKSFNRSITVHTKLGGNLVTCLKWENMKFSLVCKWEWYFRYRAALLQIKYPKYRVELHKYSQEPTGKTKIQIERDILNKNITTSRRMITKISNRIKEYENYQNTLLIPNFDDENYIKAKQKLQQYETQLTQLLKDKIRDT